MDAALDPTTQDLTGQRTDTLANAVYLRLGIPWGAGGPTPVSVRACTSWRAARIGHESAYSPSSTPKTPWRR